MSKRVRVFAPLFAVVVAMSSVFVIGAGPASALSPPYPTVTHVKTSKASLVTGQPVTFTAAVTTAHTSSLATGSVTFTITGSDLSTVNCDGASNTIALTPGTPTQGSTAVCSVSGGLLAAGSQYTVAVSYPGDGTHLMSNGTYSQTVLLGATKPTLSSSSNPSVTGQPVTFTATVAPTSPAVGNPTGTVTFAIMAAGNAFTVNCDGGDVVNLVSQMAQCVLSGGLLAHGSTYHVVATYSGNGNFQPSTSASFSQFVHPDATTIVVNSSANPVVTGQPVTFTAVLTPNPPGGGTFTGTVTFKIVVADGGTAPHCDGGNTNVPISGNQATCAFAGGLLSSGVNYTVSATLDDDNFVAVAAGSFTEAVNQAATNITFAVSPSSVHAGQTFSITATVTPVAPGVGTPTGLVDFSICQPLTTGICVGGPIAMPASAGGVATFTLGGGELPGQTVITTTYFGDSNFTLSSTNRTITVGLVATTVGVFSSKNPSVNGQQVSFTAGVLSTGGSSALIGPPTGVVSFTITGMLGDTLTCQGGSNDIGLNMTNLTQAVAVCVIPAGMLSNTDSPYTVSAIYTGDSNYHGSAGSLAPNQEVL